MQTGSTLVLILYTWCAFRSGLHVEERPAAMPPEPKNSVLVTDVVHHWTEAMNDIHRVDAEFVRYTYDLTYETTTVAEGQLVCEAGSRQFVSLKPLSGNIGRTCLKKSGKPFDVRPACAERFIIDHGALWEIDDDHRTALKLRYDPTLQTNLSLAPKWSVWEYFDIFGEAYYTAFTTVGQFVGPVKTSQGGVTLLSSNFDNRFTITITQTKATYFRLHLVPKSQRDAAWCSEIDVLLSRATWLPDAVQFIDSAGTKVNVYVIKKRRINDCEETNRHLFEPDLTTYDFHTPGEMTPVAAAQ
jgi:hypothetical protein